MNVHIIASKYNSVIELGPRDKQYDSGDVCITVQGMAHNTESGTFFPTIVSFLIAQELHCKINWNKVVLSSNNLTDCQRQLRFSFVRMLS